MKFCNVTIEIKAVDQCFPMLIKLCQVVQTFEFVDKILKCDGTVTKGNLELFSMSNLAKIRSKSFS